MRKSVGKSTLREDCRGAVFAESVIMLPFFILILQGYTFVHSSYRSRIVLQQQAKTCAWEFANRGCDGAPARCQNQAGGALGVQGLESVRTAPIIGPLMDQLLGTRQRFTHTMDINRPSYFGGGTQTLVATQSMACNTKPTNVFSLFGNMISSLFSGDPSALGGSR